MVDLSKAPYHFALHFEEGVTARAWLNDLPIHKVPRPGPDSMSGGANHFLVPGRNKLALEVWHLPPAPPVVPIPSGDKPVRIVPVGMKIYQVVDASAEPIQIAELTSVNLPFDIPLRPGESVEMPLYHEVEFDLPFPVTEPVFWRAKAHEVPCAGTPDLHRVVTEVHAALTDGNLRRFLEMVALKHESYAASYPGEPSAAVDRQRSAIERFFSHAIRVKPLDLTKVHFEPRLNGRVIYVSGWDDRPVLEAAADDLPGMALRANLLLTDLDGQFRIFG